MTQPRRLSTRKKALFALAAVVGFVLALEGALRVAGYPKGIVRSFSRLWNPDPNATLGLFRPGEHHVTFPRELAYRARINELGLRGPSLSEKKPEGTYRILALGDSVTFGFYVDDAETFPAQLAGLLGESLPDGRRIEVVNGGCGHFSVGDEREYLSERLLRLEPDVVLLQFCSNDLSERELLREPSLYRKLASGEEAKSDWLRQTALGEFQLQLAISYKEWRRRRKGDWPPKGFNGERLETSPAAWERYTKELSALSQLLAKRGVPLLVLGFADLVEVEADAPESELERGLAERCAELDLPFRGAWTRYRQAKDVKKLYHWPYDAHPSAEGNRLLAETARELLREAKLVP